LFTELNIYMVVELHYNFILSCLKDAKSMQNFLKPVR
jgi:hypothetical protein